MLILQKKQVFALARLLGAEIVDGYASKSVFRKGIAVSSGIGGFSAVLFKTASGKLICCNGAGLYTREIVEELERE